MANVQSDVEASGFGVNDVEVSPLSHSEVDAAAAPREKIISFLRQLGAGAGIIDAVKRRSKDVDVQAIVARFRRFAQENPAVVLAALSAVVVGGGVAAERAVRSSRAGRRRAASGRSKKAAAKRSSASRKSSGASKTSSSKSKSSSSTRSRRSASKRTIIEPHEGDKRYVRRDAEGHFKKEVNVGRSLAADRRRTSKTSVKKGQGDRGDVRR